MIVKIKQHNSKKPIVGIRVDATARIGSGHATRCIAIAESLKELGCDVLFLVSCLESSAVFEDQGFEVCIIEGDEKRLANSDAMRLCGICETKHMEALLIDSYGITPQFMDVLNDFAKGNLRTALIDDMYTYETGLLDRPKKYDVDVIIGGDPFFDAGLYRELYEKAQTDLLVGPEYLPIRRDLPVPVSTYSDVITDIMITTGSTNPDGLLERMSELAKMAVGDTSINIHVIVGPKAIFKGSASDLIIHDGDPIVDVMKECQLAFSSAGITLLELIAMGIPTLAIEIVDNQHAAVVDFKRRALGFGCTRFDKDEDIVSQLKLLLFDSDLRKDMSQRCRSLIDGRGASRIANRIMSISLER